MKAVVSVAEMRNMDEAEILRGTSAAELMRRAGEAVFASYSWRDGVAVLCGSGNNGGDGFVLASYLRKNGYRCRLLLLGMPRSEVAAAYFSECVKSGIPWRLCKGKEDFSEDTVLVDCLFGTGFHGTAEGIAADLIESVNASGKPVVSVDINSGMNGDNGRGTPCIRSDVTVAIGCLKYGHVLGNAKDLIGGLTCVDIGIPLREPCRRFLIEATDAREIFSYRLRNSHKGTYGYVALLGGCRAYAGAAKLANLSCAALRAGCGVATLAVPEGLCAAISPYLLESTLYPMPDNGAGGMRFCEQSMAELLEGKRAVAVGMGWGRSEENKSILRYLLKTYSGTLIIDADGLNSLSEMEPSILQTAVGRVVLTPHPKEFQRLSGISMEKITEDPVGSAEAYAQEKGVILLLKGACTVVTDGECTYFSDRGCAGMATAGSGDVLSGLLVGLLGYADANAKTVACGAFTAGLAGELAERDVNPVSMLASDTVAHIAEAVTRIINGSVE